jgi:catechol 2,3-dioxygenase-like lactoylglutathione lyase family enzyme
MISTQMSTEHAGQAPAAAAVDLKLEVIVIPVSDVDRAKRFYQGLNWQLDADFSFDNGFRVVQLTPPGSACSVQFGTNITSATPGSAQGLYLVVSEIEAARDELLARGVQVSEVFHAGTPGAQFQPAGTGGRVSGPAPDHASYGSFATFSDPDGNGWLVQEIKTRLPGRGLSRDLATLEVLLQDAEKQHGEHGATAPKHHWSEWYAGYMIARERGKTVDEAAKEATLNIERRREAAQE